jgi:hypothetical protein
MIDSCVCVCEYVRECVLVCVCVSVRVLMCECVCESVLVCVCVCVCHAGAWIVGNRCERCQTLSAIDVSKSYLYLSRYCSLDHCSSQRVNACLNI